MTYTTRVSRREVEAAGHDSWQRRRDRVHEKPDQEQEQEHQEEEGRSRGNPFQARASMELSDDLALFWLESFGDPDEAEYLFPEWCENSVTTVDYGMVVQSFAAGPTQGCWQPANHNGNVDQIAMMRLRALSTSSAM